MAQVSCPLSHTTRISLTTTLRFKNIKACTRAAGFTGNTSQAPLLTYMAFKSRVQGLVSKAVGPAMLREKGHKANDVVGTLRSHIGCPSRTST